MSNGTPTVMPAAIDWFDEELERMWEKEDARQQAEPTLFLKNVRQRLVDGDISEGQLVDMLAARGISLLEANEMSDEALVTQLTIIGTTASIGSFDRIMTPRFTLDTEELNVQGIDIRQILADNAIACGAIKKEAAVA